MPEELGTIPDDALPASCVRIDVGNSPVGSGFFVAPGIVVTCNHVLQLERLSSAEASRDISVVWPRGGRSYEVLDDRERSPTDQDDLAILRVAPTDDHPCALLDPGLRARDKLHTYGYPQHYPNGAPTSLVAEGWMEEDRWLKLAHGQVQPGMSGSPVVNLRTGAVCGVVKRSRDIGQGLGGYAVSVRQLFHLSPMLKTLNFRHHMTYTASWFDLLPPKERRLLLTQRTSGAMVAPPRYVLVISVDQSENDWNVTATLHEHEVDGDADADDADVSWKAGPPLGPVPVDLNAVRALVARLFRDWASRETTARGRVEPGEQIRLLGNIIAMGLLRKAVADEFERLVGELEDHGWMEVAVHFADVDDDDFREFVQLPWEHLYLPKRSVEGKPRSDLYFAKEQKLAFVRTLLPTPVTPRAPDGKLSVLVVAVKPPAYPHRPPEDTAAELGVDSITRHLAKLGEESDALDVSVIEAPGIVNLMDELAPGYDVVHYVGYGRLVAGRDRIALAADAANLGEGVDAGNFAECLAEKMPALVVLQFCRGSEAVPADLSEFGPALLMKGCRAVVANQYPVVYDPTKTVYTGETLNEAEKFNAALYESLVSGVSLELAAQIARKKVWSGDQESRAFLSPAVFVKNPGGLRLIGGREIGLRPRVGSIPSHA